jgi:hypothetical protein
MTDTTQEELPPLPDECYKYERLINAMHEWGRQCIATLKAKNEMLRTLLIDAESVMVSQRDDRLAQGARAQAAESQAAAMAGLLEEARIYLHNVGNWGLRDDIDAALAAWREKQ